MDLAYQSGRSTIARSCTATTPCRAKTGAVLVSESTRRRPASAGRIACSKKWSPPRPGGAQT